MSGSFILTSQHKSVSHSRGGQKGRRQWRRLSRPTPRPNWLERSGPPALVETDEARRGLGFVDSGLSSTRQLFRQLTSYRLITVPDSAEEDERYEVRVVTDRGQHVQEPNTLESEGGYDPCTGICEMLICLLKNWALLWFQTLHEVGKTKVASALWRPSDLGRYWMLVSICISWSVVGKLLFHVLFCGKLAWIRLQK